MESETRVLQSRCLPRAFPRKCRIALFSATPKVAWGWLCRRPSLEDIRPWNAACKALFKSPKQASVHLTSMIRGHRWDVRFMGVSTTLSVLHRHVTRTGNALTQWCRAASGWVGALRRGLSDLGWAETVTPWAWTHAPLQLKLSLVQNQSGWKQDMKAVQHDLRESWRYTCFSKFQAQTQNDAHACRGVGYCPERLRAPRSLDLNSHRLAVLAGASVSPAMFKVMRPDSSLGSAVHGHVRETVLQLRRS